MLNLKQFLSLLLYEKKKKKEKVNIIIPWQAPLKGF